MFTAKNAAHGQRFLLIGNHQGVCLEFSFVTIQQAQGFTFAGHTHHDTALNTIEVEGMHWLTQFHQHVVSHINHGINRANTCAAQLLTHPQR
ncbi:hypothetical protein D3C75_1189280 [compost metagenome]